MLKPAVSLFIKALIIGVALNLGIQFAASVAQPRIQVKTLQETQPGASSLSR